MALIQDFKDGFVNDYDDEIDLQWVYQVLSSGNCRLICDQYDYPVGGFWLDGIMDDLHGRLHFIIRPEYLKQCLKQDLFNQWISETFEQYGFSKLIAECYNTQKTAIKLLRKYQFYEHKPFFKHTRQKGVIVDLIVFELRRRNWEKRNGNRKPEKQLEQ